jgi:6-methylsalicylate decarboxylase
VLSPTVGPYLADADEAAEAARLINDLHAGVVARHPARFAAFTALPLPHVELALAELERGLDDLGLLGVAMHCSVLDRSIADETFDPVLAAVPHLGGALPMLLNRLDNQLAMSVPGLAEPPSRTARRFWYDTVGHGSAAALRAAVEAFGVDRLVSGSDYPVMLAFQSYADTFDQLRAAGLSQADLRGIFRSNAEALFRG